jgi:glutamyl-Q tRNA(Asp) synthetase
MRETTLQGQEYSQAVAPSEAASTHRTTLVRAYRGRFAPSPTGPLHAGSLVAALASWLDARAHNGNWLIRMENVDTTRERAGAAEVQLAQLERYGMRSDEPVLWQTQRYAAYEAALQQLQDTGRTYYCQCSRTRIAGTQGEGGPAYPGTCRALGLAAPGSIRLRVDPGEIAFLDRACGPWRQEVARAVGDFVIRRSDGLWAYQLAVVVDDAAQGITDVVRGADLLDNTPRQILLQRALQLPTPRYLHVPLVCDGAGRKLSKQDAAQPLGSRPALVELEQAWQHLGYAPTGAPDVAQFLARAVLQWSRRHGPTAGSATPAAASPVLQEPS